MKFVCVIAGVFVLLSMYSCKEYRVVRIHSDEGAVILINNEVYDPSLDLSLSFCSINTIKISKEGYYPIEEEFLVLEDRDVYEYKLIPVEVSLNIRSETPGIEFYIHDQKVHLPASLKRGTYHITAKSPGYKTQVVELNMENDLVYSLNLIKKVYAVNLEKEVKIYDQAGDKEVTGQLNLHDSFEVLSAQYDRKYLRIRYGDNREGVIYNQNVAIAQEKVGRYLLGIMKEVVKEVEFHSEIYPITNSKLFIFDTVEKTYQEKIYIDKGDNLTISLEDKRLVIQGSFNNNGFPSAYVNYIYYYFYDLEKFDIKKPLFYYFEELSSQGMPSMDIRIFKMDGDTITLRYSYMEMTGLPQTGTGSVQLEYLFEDDGYKLNNYSFDGELDETWYDAYPYKSYRISREYNTWAGQGWIKSGEGHTLPLKDLSGKFSYFIERNKPFFGVD